jgi:hypothetical protein
MGKHPVYEGASLILRLAGLEETGVGRLPAVPGVRRAHADGPGERQANDSAKELERVGI